MIAASCPDVEALVAFAEGRLDEPVRRRLERHIDDCADCRVAVAAAMDAEEPAAAHVDRFEFHERLGEGGMGVVYAAYDRHLQTPVAIKMLRPDQPPSAAGRLEDEVRLARRVRHPNVCAVYDLIEVDGSRVLVMERVDGETLDRWLATSPDAAARARALRQITAGLTAAHVEQVVHRDLKPHNIMLEAGGQVRIMDFGLAVRGRAADSGCTPRWAAPEQIDGQATARSDVYALGLLAAAIYAGHTEPSVDRRAIPRRLRRWIDRCRAPDPADRFADAGAAARALALTERSRAPIVAAAMLIVASVLTAWGWSVASAPSAAAMQAFEDGRAALDGNRSWRAALRFRDALAIDPDFARAALWLALVRDSRGDRTGARDVLGRAMLDADRLDRRERFLLLALDAKLRHDPDAAAGHLDALLTHFPDDRHARFMRGDLLFHTGEFSAAVDHLGALLTAAPDYGLAWHHLIWALYGEGRLDEARRHADRWQARGDGAKAGVVSAQLALAVGDLDRAEHLALQASRAHPDDLESLSLPALIRLARGDSAGALVALDVAARNIAQRGGEGGGEIQRRRAWVLAHAGRWQAAYAQYTELLAHYDAELARGKTGPVKRRRLQIRAEQALLAALSPRGRGAAAKAVEALRAQPDALGDMHAAGNLALTCWALDDRPCLDAVARAGWPSARAISDAHRLWKSGAPGAARDLLDAAIARREPGAGAGLRLLRAEAALAAGDTPAGVGPLRFITPQQIFARVRLRCLLADHVPAGSDPPAGCR